MIVRDTSELAKNIFNKNLLVSKVLLKKIFEYLLYHSILNVKGMFLLMPSLNYFFTELQGNKRDLIWPIGLGNFEIVFILLAKLIAIQI